MFEIKFIIYYILVYIFLVYIYNHYFLIQRIKSPTKENGLSNNEYLNLLSAAHQVLVLSMKAKQQVNLDVSAQLLSQLESFETQYLAYKK